MPVKIPVTVVRCGLNRYDTPLFSYDNRGIYIKCKDCRDAEGHRGAYHLYTWATILTLMYRAAIGGVLDGQAGQGAAGFARLVEGVLSASSVSGGGDPGAQLHESHMEVPSGAAPDPEHGTTLQ